MRLVILLAESPKLRFEGGARPAIWPSCAAAPEGNASFGEARGAVRRWLTSRCI